ncbi:hypothetical protein BpHYR1_000754 [Brachionus plicatilis]|uniref:Uncharacterized protein n=1 Tax=Brachionus plicatilis TaxID=10195 RepID=A0A3M7S2W7_BRAPC|nr:hypothetical protein BpHYR1_000754 [Brachionus plicatilis]
MALRFPSHSQSPNNYYNPCQKDSREIYGQIKIHRLDTFLFKIKKSSVRILYKRNRDASPSFKILNTKEEIYAKIATKF